MIEGPALVFPRAGTVIKPPDRPVRIRIIIEILEIHLQLNRNVKGDTVRLQLADQVIAAGIADGDEGIFIQSILGEFNRVTIEFNFTALIGFDEFCGIAGTAQITDEGDIIGGRG